MQGIDIVFYHGGCLDGYAAATIAWRVLGKEALYVPLYYKDGLPSPRTPVDVAGKNILLTDIATTSLDHMNRLFGPAARCLWLDHHDSTFDAMSQSADTRRVTMDFGDGTDSTVILDRDKCGALITWDVFFNTEPPEVLRAIDAYDRGGTFQGWAPEGTLEVVKALWSFAPWSFERMSELLKRPTDAFLREGETLIRDHEARAGKAAAEAVPGTFFPNGQQLEVLGSNCSRDLHSTVGHTLAGLAPSGVGLCWVMGRGNKAYVSVRANDGKSARALAESLGGGGHGNAAGFEMDITRLLTHLHGYSVEAP